MRTEKILHSRPRRLGPGDIGKKAVILRDMPNQCRRRGDRVVLLEPAPPSDHQEPKWRFGREDYELWDLVLPEAFYAAETDLCLVEWLQPTDHPLTDADSLDIALILVDVELPFESFEAGDRVVLLERIDLGHYGDDAWSVEKVGGYASAIVPEAALQHIWYRVQGKTQRLS